MSKNVARGARTEACGTCRESGVQPARVLKEMKPAAVRLHLAEMVTSLDDYVACPGIRP